MTSKNQEALTLLNSYFYHTYYSQFSATRNSPWSGWQQSIKHISSSPFLLDAACGNGRFYKFLESNNWNGTYKGQDASAELIKLAQSTYPNVDFTVKELVEGIQSLSVDTICAFGVLHHIGTEEYLENFFDSCYHHGEQLIISKWNIVMNPGLLAKRVNPSDKTTQEFLNQFGIDQSWFGPHEYLFGWNNDYTALRFVRYWPDATLLATANRYGWELNNTWLADGRSSAENTYFVFRKANASIRKYDQSS